MRHIDDGYSYEFYAYEQDVIDYYRRKSDYDTDDYEREYRGSMVTTRKKKKNESTFSFGNF